MPSEITCDPSRGGCASARDYADALGIPIKDIYVNSKIGKSQSAIDDRLNFLEEELTRGITKPFWESIFLNQEYYLAEKVVDTFQPITQINPEGPAINFIKNTSDSVYWQWLSMLDPPEKESAVIQILKDKRKAALQCRLFNGRLQGCEPKQTHIPTIPPNIPSTGPTFPSGIAKNIFIYGFQVSCMIQGGCIIGSPRLQPQTFDGLYNFAAIDSDGFPIYVKPNVFFNDFEGITSLYIFRKISKPNNILPKGAAAFIIPNAPSINVLLLSIFRLLLRITTP